jgi:hypothetical protein
VNLSVVWIFTAVMIGGLALGTVLILSGPRDDEAAALYRRQARDAVRWLHDRVRSTVSRTPSEPRRVSRR